MILFIRSLHKQTHTPMWVSLLSINQCVVIYWNRSIKGLILIRLFTGLSILSLMNTQHVWNEVLFGSIITYMYIFNFYCSWDLIFGVAKNITVESLYQRSGSFNLRWKLTKLSDWLKNCQQNVHFKLISFQTGINDRNLF